MCDGKKEIKESVLKQYITDFGNGVFFLCNSGEGYSEKDSRTGEWEHVAETIDIAGINLSQLITDNPHSEIKIIAPAYKGHWVILGDKQKQ